MITCKPLMRCLASAKIVSSDLTLVFSTTAVAFEGLPVAASVILAFSSFPVRRQLLMLEDLKIKRKLQASGPGQLKHVVSSYTKIVCVFRVALLAILF
jgi:hypothetical protein